MYARVCMQEHTPTHTRTQFAASWLSRLYKTHFELMCVWGEQNDSYKEKNMQMNDEFMCLTFNVHQLISIFQEV